MRVIAGKYKGHSLVSFDATHIRPTTDRVKETLFNIIQLSLDEDTIVADCFAGTGSLGIEAISRGARFVYFVEQNKQSIQILKKNLAKLKIPTSQYKILNQDVLQFFQKFDLSGISLYLIDPPFTKQMANTTMSMLSSNSTLKSGSTIAIESLAQETILDQYGSIQLIKRKEFNDKLLSIFQVINVG
jgi:16S rRNA (guanine966-N2)-methyltransferase